MATMSAMDRTRSQLAIMIHIASKEMLIQSRYRNKFFSDIFSHFLGVAPILLIAFALSGSTVDGSSISDVTRERTLFILLGYTAFMAFGFGTPIMLYTGMGWGIAEEVYTGTIERNFLAPVHRSLVILGIGGYYVVLYSFHALSLIVVAALLLGDSMTFSGEGLAIAALTVLGLLAFSIGLGLAASGLFLAVKDSSFHVLVVHRPFLLFSGAIFILDVLPRPLKLIALANPVTYGIDAFRGALSDTDTLLNPWIEIGILFAGGAAAFVLGMAAFNYALKRQLRTGDLTRF